MFARIHSLIHALMTAYLTVVTTMTGPSPSEMVAAITAVALMSVKSRVRLA